ncbi:MAG: hypothetical protein JNM09_28020 [Blastocatellia bacterium]|nr:hypothetical protein [Blastocatellia bacterium]
MNDHLSDSQLLLYQARALPSAAMMTALEHLSQCLPCRQRHHAQVQVSHANQASTITLSPAWQWQHEHLDVEQVQAWVSKSLDQEDEEIAQAHLQTCQRCRAEVQDWLAFQRELHTELRTRYGPQPTTKAAWQGRWRSWEWKPMVATLLGTACLLLTIGAILSQIRRSAQPPLATTIPAPTATVLAPSPMASPATPLPPEKSEETIIASLHDGVGIIAMTKEGNIAGLPKVTDELRGDIVAALRTGKLNPPELLQDLASEVGTVRGKTTGQAAAPVLTPAGITVLDTRPRLQWQPVENAVGYEIEIADGRGNEVARSAQLAETTHHWQPPQALPRGVMYTWTVHAIYAEPVAAATLPTGRFKVLGASETRELTHLQAQTNSHLVRGLFYARAGMLPEARRELKLLVKQNPDEPLARQLLRTVQAWR